MGRQSIENDESKASPVMSEIASIRETVLSLRNKLEICMSPTTENTVDEKVEEAGIMDAHRNINVILKDVHDRLVIW